VDCIFIEPAETDDAIERYPKVFDIDMGRCMFCGLCEEACPEEAIVMSDRVEISGFSREALLWNKENLLVPVDQLPQRLEHPARLRAKVGTMVTDPRAAPRARNSRPSIRSSRGYAGTSVMRCSLRTRFRGDVTVIVLATSPRGVSLPGTTPRSASTCLVDVTAVDYLGRIPRFEVVYHLYPCPNQHPWIRRSRRAI
jgi:ferredoxin